jgi:predicted nucleotidyltransferase
LRAPPVVDFSYNFQRPAALELVGGYGHYYTYIARIVSYMDLAVPLRSIIPSLDSDVFRVLAETVEPMSARRIHGLARKGSYAGVKNALHRLREHGLVTSVEAPPANLYAANRMHLAWPAIEQLARLRQLLFDKVRGEISDWKPSPDGAFIYGSTARGDGDNSSDIDLLFVTKESRRDAVGSHAVDLGEHIRAWTGNSVQVTVFTPADVRRLADLNDPVLMNIRRDAVLVGGDRSALR